ASRAAAGTRAQAAAGAAAAGAAASRAAAGVSEAAGRRAAGEPPSRNRCLEDFRCGPSRTAVASSTGCQRWHHSEGEPVMGRLTITRLPAGLALAAALTLLANPSPGAVVGAAGGAAPSPPTIPVPDHA